jgi:hypothetical protein
VKLVGKIKQAVSFRDEIRVIALHAAKVVSKLGRYALVDLPAQAAASKRETGKIKVGTAKVGHAKVGTAKVSPGSLLVLEP